MEKVRCYFCGENETLKLLSQSGHDPYLDLIDPDFHEIDRDWEICKNCGFIFRNPMPSEHQIDKLYKDYDQDVFKNTTPDAYFDKITSFSPEESENYQKANWLENLLPDELKNKESFEILDVGCGGGTLLHTFSKILPNAKTYGVELNPQYADLAQRRSGAEVLNKAYENNLFNKKFDLIIFTKVLEHILKPMDFLKNFPNDLNPGGLLFLEVPDVSDFKNLGSDHERFFIPHLYYYSPEIMQEMLHRIGFDILECRSIATHRGRGYLQVLGKFTGISKTEKPPFVDAESFLKSLS